MLCTMCGKNQANAYTRRTQEGEKQVFLCPDCYSRLYGGKKDDFIASYLNSAADVRTECPKCGMTLEEFRKTNLLGCADCYSAFREAIIPTVQVMQGRLQHTGKDPYRTLENERRELEAELRDAQKMGDRFMEQRIRYRLSVIHRLTDGGEA